MLVFVLDKRKTHWNVDRAERGPTKIQLSDVFDAIMFAVRNWPQFCLFFCSSVHEIFSSDANIGF